MEAVQTILVRNMVCNRCVITVKDILGTVGINYAHVSLGKILLRDRIPGEAHHRLQTALQEVGLEIIEGRTRAIVEQVKQALAEYLELGIDNQQYKLSAFVASRVHYEFSYVSDLFSSLEGVSVERYFILQRIEKVKELLAYDELTISEISYSTGFSSIHHLSAQFRKVTGMTPSQFKQTGNLERQPIDMLHYSGESMAVGA